MDVENSHVRILGSLVLNLWDCGGCVFMFCPLISVHLHSNRVIRSQDAFYEHYFDTQRDHIFSNVELLIYVWDIESRDLDVRGFSTYRCVLLPLYGA